MTGMSVRTGHGMPEGLPCCLKSVIVNSDLSAVDLCCREMTYDAVMIDSDCAGTQN